MGIVYIWPFLVVHSNHQVIVVPLPDFRPGGNPSVGVGDIKCAGQGWNLGDNLGIGNRLGDDSVTFVTI